MFSFLFRYSLNADDVSFRGTVQIENDRIISVLEDYTRARKKEMSQLKQRLSANLTDGDYIQQKNSQKGNE